MDKTIEDELKEIERLHSKNQEVLELFRTSLVESGLRERTVERHLENVEFYLDDFLADYYQEPMQSGIAPGNLNSFFDDFYIRKGDWTSVSSLKEATVSIKKFYKCMLENKRISKEDYQGVVSEIRENLSRWTDRLNKYEDLDTEYEEIWGDYF